MRQAMARVAAAGSGAWLVVELGRGGVPWTPAFVLALAALWMLRERGAAESTGGTAWLVFWSCLAFYLSTFRWHGGDDAPNSLLPFCILRSGTFALNPVLDPWFLGKTDDFTVKAGANALSIFPVAPAILALPFYVIPAAAGVVADERFLHNMSKLSASTIVAASAAVLFLTVARRCSRRWALCLAGLYGLGSWSFSVSSQALWQHGPAQLGVALALFGLGAGGAGDLAIAGLGAGLATAARPDNVFYSVALGIYALLKNRARAAAFAAGALVPALLLAAYWLYYTGRLRPPESVVQGKMLGRFEPKVALWLLASPTRGLFFFFPAAAFGIWGALRRGSEDGRWLLASCVGTIIFLCFYSGWSGGQTFGTRYFATAALVFTYLCADLEAEIRGNGRLLSLWCAAVAASILIHASGGYFIWPGSYEHLAQRAEIWRWDYHPFAHLYSARGGFANFPAAARAASASAIVLAFAGLAVWLRRWLSEREASR
ncbi:MAG: hypothetical protein HY078_05920 [Elusimicrobia bacterium]|nr:hypothetical protein [Elusimicrobiota bacterium]